MLFVMGIDGNAGELPQLSDGNFLLPKDEIVSHLQTVRVGFIVQ
jgi:hypothetical protein